MVYVRRYSPRRGIVFNQPLGFAFQPELDQVAHGLWPIDCRIMLFSDPFVDLLELRAAEDDFKHLLKLLLQN